MDYCINITKSLQEILTKLFSITDNISLFMRPPYLDSIVPVKRENLTKLDYLEILKNLSCINVDGYLIKYDEEENRFYFPLRAKSLAKINTPIVLQLATALESPISIINTERKQELIEYLKKYSTEWEQLYDQLFKREDR
jgi:hypothetical protein